MPWKRVPRESVTRTTDKPSNKPLRFGGGVASSKVKSQRRRVRKPRGVTVGEGMPRSQSNKSSGSSSAPRKSSKSTGKRSNVASKTSVGKSSSKASKASQKASASKSTRTDKESKRSRDSSGKGSKRSKSRGSKSRTTVTHAHDDHRPGRPGRATNRHHVEREVKALKERASTENPPTYRARENADVNAGFPIARFSVRDHKIVWGKAKHYDMSRSRNVGRGAYGEVFLSTDKRTKRPVAIKVLKPEKEAPGKLEIEVAMLRLVREGPNIVQLEDVVEEPKHRLHCLVFEYVQQGGGRDTRDMYMKLPDIKLRRFCYRVLKGLAYIHSIGIMHRDMKAGNVLYNPNTEDVRIIDWGFAEFYFPDRPIDKWPGTRSHKSLDLFFHYPLYDYSVDMWAYGCMVGAMMLKTKKLFPDKNANALLEKDNWSHILGIMEVLGTIEYKEYCARYGFRESHTRAREQHDYQGRGLRSFVHNKNKDTANKEALDLLGKIMEYDHEVRITATEALEHSYFDPVRDEDSKASSTHSTIATEEASDNTSPASEASDAGSTASSSETASTGRTRASKAKASKKGTAASAAAAKTSRRGFWSRGKAKASEKGKGKGSSAAAQRSQSGRSPATTPLTTPVGSEELEEALASSDSAGEDAAGSTGGSSEESNGSESA